MRRARILAFLLDMLLCVPGPDAAGLAATALFWFWLPAWRNAIPWLWAGVAAGAIGTFLLRDASGGRARRLLVLKVVDRDGGPPGAWASIRRNLPLLIPIWNVFEAWPVL